MVENQGTHRVVHSLFPGAAVKKFEFAIAISDAWSPPNAPKQEIKRARGKEGDRAHPLSSPVYPAHCSEAGEESEVKDARLTAVCCV